jgi:hypothetical protein
MNNSGLLISTFIIITLSVIFFLLYEIIIWPFIVRKTGESVDANTDRDGTLTENKNKLNGLDLKSDSSSTSDSDGETEETKTR